MWSSAVVEKQLCFTLRFITPWTACVGWNFLSRSTRKFVSSINLLEWSFFSKLEDNSHPLRFSIRKTQFHDITFTHPSQNCYSCPFSPVWVSTLLWNAAAQELLPDFPKLNRDPEHLATMTQPPARVDTKPLKSGTRVARIRTRDVLSTVTVSFPPGPAQNKIQLSRPGWKVRDKAEGLRHRTQGHPVSGLFPGEGVAHQRSHATFAVP